MEDQRWLHCEIKLISLLRNVPAARYTAEHGVVEAIQFRDGFLTETSSSNVWIVKNRVLMAPPKNNLILGDIRYGLIGKLYTAGNIQFNARRLSRDAVFDADAVLLSSAIKETFPVTAIDDKIVRQG